MATEIQKIEQTMMELGAKLHELRKKNPPTEIKNYTLKDQNGDVTLRDLFGDAKTLFAIHNMGQGCRYCTLWADGFNGFLPHLEDQSAVVLLSKDSPEVQRRFANSRGWRFRMASHGGGDYIQEQRVTPGEAGQPGIVCYIRDGERILRKNATPFGPGDMFCPQWQILSLGGITAEDWTAQYSYWARPAKLDDGGQNVR